MRPWLPIILILLAVFTAGCIAYIAWELTSEQRDQPDHDSNNNDSGSDDSGNEKSA